MMFVSHHFFSQPQKVHIWWQLSLSALDVCVITPFTYRNDIIVGSSSTGGEHVYWWLDMISETAEVERIANYTEEFTRDLLYMTVRSRL